MIYKLRNLLIVKKKEPKYQFAKIIISKSSDHDSLID